ncbi:MAG: hypothetical protein ACOY94_04735 [Bacillota bacterium]
MRRTLALLILALLLLPQAALADSAPLYPAGPTLQPLAETRVRMASEAIAIHVGRARPLDAVQWQELQADVHVTFHFVPAADESLEVGFPLRMSLPRSNGSERLEGFSVKVDGQPLPHTEREVTYGGETTGWAVWQMAFKQGQPQNVAVSYRIRFSRGKLPELRLFYILKTGAFWDGTIGHATAAITFDRPLRAGDILAETTPGFRHDGETVRWEWRELEPDFDIHLQVNDIFWLDLPAEAEALLTKELTRESLLAASTVVAHMLSLRDRGGGWMKVRGGLHAGDAAEPLLPRLLAGYDQLLKANPQDTELRQKRLELVQASLWDERHTPERGFFRHLQSSERLRLYIELVRQEEQQTGSRIARSDDRARHLVWTYQDSTDHSLRAAVLGWMTELMPDSFATDQSARNWVGEVLRQWHAPLPELEADLLKVALPRAKASTPPPTTETPPPAEPAPNKPEPEKPEPEPEPEKPSIGEGVGAAFLIFAAAILLFISLKWFFLWRRIRHYRPIVGPPPPPRDWKPEE